MELRSAEADLAELRQLYERLRQRNLALPALSIAVMAETEVGAASEHAQSSRATESLRLLETIRERLQGLQELTDRFRKRRTEKDPVTDKPRYGEKTMKRVNLILEMYEDLQNSIATVYGEEEGVATPVIEDIRKEADQEKEEKIRRQKEKARKIALEEKRANEEEERLEEERKKVEEAERLEIERQREELARQAEASRLAQLRAQQAVERADREWMDGVPKGPDGVKAQLAILVESTKDDPGAQNTAVGALHTLFSQIIAHPEETNFRRIRRDHPRFNEEIGRHPGGKEVLIAAGFVLGAIDDVPSFISKEPNIEKDMDGWAAWFDLLKATLSIIEDQLMK